VRWPPASESVVWSELEDCWGSVAVSIYCWKLVAEAREQLGNSE
jgi:hypothetical protein